MHSADKNINREARTEPRRRRLAEAARANILAAAEAMLIASGPQSLKLTSLARAAGVSNASVLHHFGSVDGVQTALMERMVRALVDEVFAIAPSRLQSMRTPRETVTALFDAFEARGAARLAAWLELTGEGRRLTLTRGAIREILDAAAKAYPQAPAGVVEDYILVCITMALAVGLFGPALGDLLGRPPGRAREVALALLLSRLGAGG
jgi:AcrR family transcriptional regulator